MRSTRTWPINPLYAPKGKSMSLLNKKMLAVAIGLLGGNGFPTVNEDFTRENGTLGNGWNGSTWSIVNNAAVNSPTLGAELLTDPGLEGTYTSGTNVNLTKTGSPTVSQSADAHGGSKAQQFTATAFNNRLNYPTAAGIARQWYQFSIWGKRTAGSTNTARARVFQSNALPANTLDMAIIDAAYTQKKMSILSTTTDSLFRYAAIETDSSGFSTVIVDDGSFKAITFSSLFAMRPLSSANGFVKQKITFVDDTFIGPVARGDAETSPTNFIVTLVQRHPTYAATGLLVVYLLKKVGSTYTVLISGSGITEVAGAWLELRFSGSSVSVWYNNVQVDTTKTVSDAELLSNGYHGMFSSGDNIVTDFFMQAS
jgi:hypothetical protein